MRILIMVVVVIIGLSILAVVFGSMSAILAAVGVGIFQ